MTPAPTTPITTDLLCIACQYNLRTRTIDDRCPECGLAISDTLAHRQRHAQAIENPRLLRAACYFFALPSLACPVYVAAMSTLVCFEPSAPRSIFIAEVLLRDLGQLVFVFSLLVGVLLFLNSVSKLVVTPARRTAATMLTITYCVISFLGVLGSFSMLRHINPGRGGRAAIGLSMMRDQRIGTAFICLLLAWEGYVALRLLAKSIAEPRLATLSRWACIAVIADSAASLLIYFMLAIWRPYISQTSFQAVFTGIDIGSAAIFIFFGWHWLRVAHTVRHLTSRTPLQAAAVSAPTVSPQEKIDAFLSRRKVDSAP